MTNELPSALKALADDLEHLAMYNDKGWQWAKHSLEERAETHQKFQASLEEHARTIGQDAIPADLWAAIMSGAAARDETGKFWILARRALASVG
ncbi:MAG: hypothetical protein ACLGI6_03795 [Gammaproteobacteria bacterium]